MVGIWHWHIPTFIITDISPLWWDFVMVGTCRQAIIITFITMILHHHHQVAVITCTHYSSIQSIINGLKEDDFYSGWFLSWSELTTCLIVNCNIKWRFNDQVGPDGFERSEWLCDDVNVLKKKKMASYSFLHFFETKSESSINFPPAAFVRWKILCALHDFTPKGWLKIIGSV